MNFIYDIEDEMIYIHGDSGYVATLRATCPEQANDFQKTFKNKKQTLKQWKIDLAVYKGNWQSFEEE